LPAILTLVIFTAYCPCIDSHPTQAATPGTAIGTAIGNGVKAFMGAAFPAGSSLLTLIQSWLTKKLSPQQQTEVAKGADTAAQNAKTSPTSKVAPQVAAMQNAAQVLQYTSVVLFHANNATVIASSMLSTVNAIGPSEKLPLSDLGSKRDDLKTELSALDPNGNLAKNRPTISDTAVLGALQQLEQVTPTNSGPFETVQDNLTANGDRSVLRSALEKIVTMTEQFNNLATVLLGSTGTEISTAVNDFKSAGGSSKLDQITEDALNQAKAKIPVP
jgi:hypothetical protein